MTDDLRDKTVEELPLEDLWERAFSVHAGSFKYACEIKRRLAEQEARIDEILADWGKEREEFKQKIEERDAMLGVCLIRLADW